MNLLLNALTAMPDGGELRATVNGDGEEARVRIADTGRGMSPAEHREDLRPEVHRAIAPGVISGFVSKPFLHDEIRSIARGAAG